MKIFFSCDWGSTRFRLRLIEAANLNVIKEIRSDHGIRVLFEQWNSGNPHKYDRQVYFSNYLSEQIEKLKNQIDIPIAGIPIMISGMASSNIGLKELPYKNFPISTDGSDLIVENISGLDGNTNPAYLISGVRTETDVARGEETMMVGCDHEKDMVELFIFPGTHSKHILIQHEIARSIQSFLTGEMFQLLSAHSILHNSVRKPEGYEPSANLFFTEGVRKGASGNFLNDLFIVRINDLFKRATAEENYSLLMGILIGHELKDLPISGIDKLVLVCSEELNPPYLQAVKVLYPSLTTTCEDAGAALIKGQWMVLQSLNLAKQL